MCQVDESITYPPFDRQRTKSDYCTMVFVCDDFNELKLVIRCALTATKTSLTVNELWSVVKCAIGGGPDCVQLSIFNYSSFDELLKDIPDVVELEDPLDNNSIVNLVSSNVSSHIENLVETNIPRPLSTKKHKHFLKDLLVPYRVQCAFIRIVKELYPEGLTIDDFESDVLCAPIFKSFADSVDQVLYILNHIFIRVGSDIITLQTSIVDGVKHLEESDEYSASDVYNINEFELENSNYDSIIAKGIEYPLCNILEESVKNNIELLFDENPNGLFEREISDLYIQKFGSSFSHYRRWGFFRVSQLFAKLPELYCIHFLEEEIQIVSKKYHVCNDEKKTSVVEKVIKNEYIITNTDVKDKRPNENDEIAYQLLKNDKFLEASLDDCFLIREFPHVELKVNTSVDVYVRDVKTDNFPIIMCQIIDESLELSALLQNMKNFYFMNESKFKFDIEAIVLKQTYAFNLLEMWFRGSVISQNFNEIKLMNIDDGLTHTIPFEDVRLLHKKYSQLPAQAITCFLDGILLFNESVVDQIIDKKCTIYIVSIDHFKTVSIKIKLFDSVSNDYLNDEWIRNGIAEPDDLSD